MSQVFPYGIAIGVDGAVATVPTVDVSVAGADGVWRTLYFILDSGATISALPRGDAAALGVAIAQGSLLTMTGFTREPLQAWRHDLSVRLGGEELRIPVAFLDTDDAPRVLGREGIFDRFTIVFEEARRRSACVATNSATAQAIHGALDQL